MRLIIFTVSLAALMACTSLLQTAAADETGLASMHAWRKVGKKTCMVDHFHSGSGSGATQKIAEMAALRDWSSFTDFEYGSDWANPRIAAQRTMRCSRESTTFACQVEALPCRPY
jgi:hypothetical protein